MEDTARIRLFSQKYCENMSEIDLLLCKCNRNIPTIKKEHAVLKENKHHNF